MKPDRHQRAMEVFLEACELQGTRRMAFLEQACADDAALRQEVESLLAHHTSATISTKADFDTAKTGRLAPAVPSPRDLATLRRRLLRLWPLLLGLLLLVLLTLLWNWVESGVRQILTDSLQNRLEMTQQANLAALHSWFAEEQEDVRGWAENDALRRAVEELVDVTKTAPKRSDLPAVLLASDAYGRLEEILEPTRDHTDELGVVLLDRTGLRLMHRDRTKVGEELPAEYLAGLRRVFNGETVLARPRRDTAQLVGYDAELKGPVTAIVAPVRGTSREVHEVIAALAFVFSAKQEFTAILNTAQLGQTGETYAFDKDAVLLSRLRLPNEQKLRQLKLLDAEQESPLHVDIRDPGGDLEAGYRPSLPRPEQPMTRMVRAAAAGHDRLDLQGYRNYRGLEVVGTWTWLPQYNFGVATEMSKAEAYAPLTYVTTAFRWLSGAVALLALATYLASLDIARLRRQVRSARQLGPYTLQELLGQGGMGKVYRATHALLRRPTAVKLLEGEQADPESVRRFEREVQLTSQLTHPNTIQIYDFGRVPDGVFYYAMEYLDGPTLAQLMAMEKQIPVARTIHILQQVCGSLCEAHERGLVHRDIKPQNIMLCCRGGMYDFVKVLDFGLIKSFVKPDHDLTRPATLSGTPAYIAPERVENPDALDGRSDLYSLGAVAHFLLTGQEVFSGNNPVDVLVQALHQDPPRTATLTAAEIPRELDDLVASCLAKDPAQRPATIRDVMRVLEPLSHRLPWPPSRAERWWQERWSQVGGGSGPI